VLLIKRFLKEDNCLFNVQPFYFAVFINKINNNEQNFNPYF